MREILFRGKSPITQKWVYGDLFQHGEQRFIMANNRNTEVIPETVGQYTGLKDKDGRGIFEGDIVRTYDPDDPPAVVKYDNRETMYAIVIDNIFYGMGEHFNPGELIVIGNIHDNPELLGDAK